MLERLAPILEDGKIEKTGHNLKFDIVVLAQHGVSLRGVAFDTMIAAFLVGEGNIFGARTHTTFLSAA